MEPGKNILVIIGSASKGSANEKLVSELRALLPAHMKLSVYHSLKSLPHFDPDLSAGDPPEAVIQFRKLIERADGVIISTPEYVFSIPASLKNAIEWCVSTTLFSGKPTGIITASAHGEKGHAELQLIMKTVGAGFTPATTLLIQGIRGKFNETGELADPVTLDRLSEFAESFTRLLHTPAEQL